MLTQTATTLGVFQKDSQYRIRETTYETIGRLGAYYGLEVFKTNFDSLYFSYLTDTVYCVRDIGIKSLDVKFN